MKIDPVSLSTTGITWVFLLGNWWLICLFFPSLILSECMTYTIDMSTALFYHIFSREVPEVAKKKKKRHFNLSLQESQHRMDSLNQEYEDSLGKYHSEYMRKKDKAFNLSPRGPKLWNSLPPHSETAWGRAAKRIKENTFCIPEIEHQPPNGRLQGNFNVYFCSLWTCQPVFLILPTPFLIQCLVHLSGLWNASSCLELYGTGVHSV